MTCRPRLLKLLFLLSFILVACRQDKPTATPPPSTSTPETAPDTSSGHSSTLISDPNALPRPRIIGRTPTAGEELTAAGTIEIYFDQPMDPAQTEAAWQLRDAEGTVITGDVSFPEPRTLRFKPDTPLRTNAVYHAEIAAAAASTSGETLLEGLTLTFNTISDLAVTQTSPADGLTDVSVNSTITVIFNRPVVPLLIAEEQADWPNPLELTPDVAGAGEWVNTSVYIFRPAAALPGKTTFTARVLAEVINSLNPNDSTLAEDYTWSFSTTAPTYQQFELVGGEINPDSYNRPLLLDQAFRIVFNQAMDPASTEAAVTLRPQAGGSPVDLLYTWNDPEEPVTLTFTPTQNLELNTIYVLTLATTAQSASGGNLRGGFTWSVRTIPAPAILSTRFEQYQGFSIQFAGPVAFSSLQDKIQFDPPIDLEDGYYNEYRYGWYFYDLAPSTTYNVTILPGIRDPYGHEITEPYTTTFTTPADSPYAQFGFPYGLTLFREGGATELYVVHRNVSRLDVAFYPLTPEYATQLLDYTLRPCSYAPDAPLWQNSRPISLAENEVGYARFDLAEAGTLPEPGFYFLSLEVPEVVNNSSCVRDEGNVIALVNANVTLKRTTTEALVWVTDLETGQPLADVPVTIYDEEQAVVATGTTDANGLVYWDDLDLLPGYEGRYLVLAADGDVFGLSLSNWGDGGYPYYFGINYDPYALTGQPTTYIYTERPLYRPGQPVSFKGIVRLNDDLAFSLPEFNTVQVTIASFNETIDTLELPLSPYGTFAGQIMLDSEATLGDYSITVRQGTQDIGYGVFAVAEYRKPTFQVSVIAEAENVLVGETVRATVEASYFAGGALGHADVAWYVQATPFSFYPGGTLSRFSFNDLDRDTGYYFYNDGFQSVEVIAQGVSTTDAQGRFTIELPTDLLATGQGQQLTLEASVTDAAGNLVSGRATVIVHPAQQYAGIRPASQISTVDEPVTLEVALVDWAAAPVANGTVTVELFERRWSSVQEEDARGQLIWRTAVEEIPIDIIESVPVDEQGRGSVSFTVPNGGVYKALVSVRDDAGNIQRASTYFWVAGDDYIPWRRSNDNNFELIADRDSYQPGDTAELLIASPFQGEATALVTVERGHIKQHEVIPLTNNSTLYRLPITGDMAPNVVVSVLIIKGSDEFNPIPDFKIGMVQLNVEREEQELTVTITPDKTEVGPGDSVTYTVEVTDHSGAPVEAELSLALSDLAALSLAPRRERPILDYFYSQRFLSVTTELLLNWLIDFYNQELPINDNQGGGDGKGIFTDLGVERVRQNFPDTAYWEGQLTTDSSGRATVTLAGQMGIHDLGDPHDYGLSFALGGGAVSLLDLTAAYAVFAAGGVQQEPYFIESIAAADGHILYTTPSPARMRVLDERVAWLISDILSDNQARTPAFGPNSILRLDRTAAAKTGTTNNFHDIWTVGYTPDLVVGVWVGNSNNEAMSNVTGVSGAGPIWHQALRAFLAGEPDKPFVQPPGLVRVEVCRLSGLLPTEACPYRVWEWFLAGTQPTVSDHFFQEVLVDKRTGLLAAADTNPAYLERQLVLDLPPEFHAWARAQGLPLLLDVQRVGGEVAAATEAKTLALAYPDPNAVFYLSPTLPLDAQRILLQVVNGEPYRNVTVWLDDQVLITFTQPPYQVWWQLEPGEHRLEVTGLAADGSTINSPPILFTVHD